MILISGFIIGILAVVIALTAEKHVDENTSPSWSECFKLSVVMLAAFYAAHYLSGIGEVKSSEKEHHEETR